MNYTENIESICSREYLTELVHGTTGDIEATDPHLN